MYIPIRDEVIPVSSLPPCEAGAPIPLVLADEFRTFVAYYARVTDQGDRSAWDVLPAADPQEEAVVLLEFSLCYAHMFGPPNDEAFSGHPLSSRGLEPYRIAEVRHSSWIADLERMNSVHPYHRPESFRAYRHYILPFHESTFECVAESVQVHLHRGSVLSAISAAVAFLREPG